MTQFKTLGLARELVARGDRLEIISGFLQIQPKSQQSVPPSWLAAKRGKILGEILASTGHKAYEYLRFTRSAAGYRDGRYPGVTLHFGEFGTDRQAYLIFNVGTTKPSGKLRKKNEFLPPASGALVKFWKRTVGDLPNQRPSRLWEHMGRLKPYLFHLRTNSNGKGENKSAGLLNISDEEIRASFTDWTRTSNGRVTDEQRTNFTDVSVVQSKVSSGLKRKSVTCNSNYERGLQGRAITRLSNSQDISNQSVEEWLAAYNSVDRTKDLQ